MKTLFAVGIVVIVAAILTVLFFGQTQSVPVGTPNQGSLPTSPTAPNQTGTQTSGIAPSSPATITIVMNDGTTVVANDFIHNNVTLADPSNAGNYYLTGPSTDGYAIGYRTPAQFFTIALEQEPLGETRIAAENFLLSALGISKNQLCNLKYYVGTDVHTNSFYAGKSLGFSFCPGAVQLP